LTRPREAPRPEHPSPPSSSSTGGNAVRLSPATFVDLSADQERHAIEALAELLVPFLPFIFGPWLAPIGGALILAAAIGGTVESRRGEAVDAVESH
jgi:hypothetical protein